MVLTEHPAPVVVTMIDKKVTFAVASDAANVWQQRFGHLGTKAIFAMSKKAIVSEIAKLEDDRYKSSLLSGCPLGQFDPKPFRSSGRHCCQPCQRIHIDIEVSMEVIAIGKYKYFLLLIQDYSCFRRFHLSLSSRHWNSTNPFVTTLGTASTQELRTSLVRMLRSLKKTSVPKVLFCMSFLITLLSYMELVRGTYTDCLQHDEVYVKGR